MVVAACRRASVAFTCFLVGCSALSKLDSIGSGGGRGDGGAAAPGPPGHPPGKTMAAHNAGHAAKVAAAPHAAGNHTQAAAHSSATSVSKAKAAAPHVAKATAAHAKAAAGHAKAKAVAVSKSHRGAVQSKGKKPQGQPIHRAVPAKTRKVTIDSEGKLAHEDTMSKTAGMLRPVVEYERASMVQKNQEGDEMTSNETPSMAPGDDNMSDDDMANDTPADDLSNETTSMMPEDETTSMLLEDDLLNGTTSVVPYDDINNENIVHAGNSSTDEPLTPDGGVTTTEETQPGAHSTEEAQTPDDDSTSTEEPGPGATSTEEPETPDISNTSTEEPEPGVNLTEEPETPDEGKSSTEEPGPGAISGEKPLTTPEAIATTSEEPQPVVAPAEPPQSILICNVFVEVELLIFSVDLPKNVTIPYKACQQVAIPFPSDPTLQFMAESRVVGSFTITASPADDTVAMALAVFSMQADPAAAEFQSHQFRNHEAAELAVFASTAAVNEAEYLKKQGHKAPEAGGQISDVGADNTTVTGITIWSDQTSEGLPLNAVVSMNPGDFRIEVGDHNRAFQAQAGGSYVVVVVGDEPKEEDVLIYEASTSGAWSIRFTGMLAFFLRTCALFFGSERH